MHSLGRWEDCVALLVALESFFPQVPILGAGLPVLPRRASPPTDLEHMKRAMTHRLQLFKLLDTSTDRLSSPVFIAPQAD